MALSEQQKEDLRQNPNVSKVTNRQVQFTYDFKVNALKRQSHGYSPNEIFHRAGIPLDWFKKSYAKDLMKNWKRIVREKGIRALDSSSGRPEKFAPPFKYDPDKLDELSNSELVQIIEFQKKELSLKKNSEPYTDIEINVEANILNQSLKDQSD